MRYISNLITSSLKVLLFISICLLYLSNSFGDTLTVRTDNIGNTLQISYVFDFNQGSPNSIIAIEKPQDSIFISAVDNQANSIRPSIIGDFYRFELVDRDIDNLTIIFTSSNTYFDIFRIGEQILYVNSNIKLERININFDVIKEFEDIIEIFPRNYEFVEETNRILITQIGALEDNMFRIRYHVENDSSFSTWIIILLTIPIIFFIALYFVLKIKPENKEKKLDDFIEKESKNNQQDGSLQDNSVEKKELNEDKNKINEKIASKINESKLEEELNSNDNSKIQIQLNPEIIYSYNENVDNDDNNTTNKKDKLNSSTENVEDVSHIESNTLSNKEKFEQYIQKYFTENEQDVIRVIKKQEGIMQQEILDNLPIFTKSTLSKIITKLEGKKIIERVRVGKVNKLFLGTELKKLVSNENN